MRGYFVTGTDTGIGKTWASCALLAALAGRGLRVAGMKPVASGCEDTGGGLRNADALSLQAVSTAPAPYHLVNPYALAPPIAPHLAAAEAGVTIEFARIRAAAASLAAGADALVVEGVGGWRVPLGREGDVAALAARLGLPVILVVGVRLGCINHARLSAEAIVAGGQALAGWIASLVDPDCQRLEGNLRSLEAGIPAPCLGVLPHLSALDPARLARALDLGALAAGRAV